MTFYSEFGGGLGDIFQQMYLAGTYCGLDHLKEDDAAVVAVLSHNPFAHELFEWHPKRPQMDLRILPYAQDGEADKLRRAAGLPPYHRGSGRVLALVDREAQPVFYPSLQDMGLIADLNMSIGPQSPGFVVIAASAGLPNRTIPAQIVAEVCEMLLAYGLVPVFTGRSYDRGGRAEAFRGAVPPGCVDFIDKLSVPGVAVLTQMASGIAGAHSALNMLGWMIRKPQLLLYPQSVEREHFIPRTWCSVGLHYPECFHARWDEEWRWEAQGFVEEIQKPEGRQRPES